MRVYIIRCQVCLLGGVWYTLRNHVEADSELSAKIQTVERYNSAAGMEVEAAYSKLRLGIVRNQCKKISRLLNCGKVDQALERFIRVWNAIDCWDYPEFYWNVLERSHPELWALVGRVEI